MEDTAATPLLVERCQTLGAKLCRYSARVQQQANALREAPFTDEEWQHCGRLAAFLAFMDIGGSAAAPDDTDWSAQELFRRALTHLQQLTLGAHSDVYDRLMRARVRRTGSQVSELQWDAWRTASMDDIRQSEAGGESSMQEADGLALYPRDAAEQYYDFTRAQHSDVPMDALILELTRVLRPQEAVWLIRRYRDGETTAAMAKEFVAKDARYQTANGMTRAMRYIDVAIHRAKKKAQRLLASHWHEMAMEVA
jgi:hypothetical protein